MKINSFFNDMVDSDCVKCGLYADCKSPYMKPTGDGKKGILVVAEAPGKTEDTLNTQLIGDAGIYLREQFKSVGIDLDVDCWKTNTVICRPKNNKTPTDTQIKLCHKNLVKTIEEKKPRIIVLLGAVAIEGMIGKYLHTTSPVSLSGRKIPFEGAWILPTFHPSYIIRNKFDENLKSYFKYSLSLIADEIKNPTKLPIVDYISKVRVSTDPDEIIKWLDNILNHPLNITTAFDIETSGLNVYQKGHKIYCMSISDGFESFSFPIEYNKYSDDDYHDIVDRVAEYMEREDLKKVAHRIQFDSIWCKEYFNCEPKGIHWCTKVGEHVCDNREGITGLKHIAFVRWGIKSYDDLAEKYTKSSKGSNFNKMDDMPINEMLLYCGIDSYLTMKLYLEQYNELKERNQLEPMTFFNEVSNMFADMQSFGIHADNNYYAEQKKLLEKEIEDGYQLLRESEEIKGFGSINFTSNDDLKRLFYQHLGCEVKKTTPKGGASVDEEALEKTDHWIAKKLVEIRKLNKVVNTYIAQFEREVCDGVIHPIFNVYIAKSYRSSSMLPNF